MYHGVQPRAEGRGKNGGGKTNYTLRIWPTDLEDHGCLSPVLFVKPDLFPLLLRQGLLHKVQKHGNVGIDTYG